MPKLLRTIELQVRKNVPKLREYVRTKGILKTAVRLASVPREITERYMRSLRNIPNQAPVDEFDMRHGVETTLRVHTTDLRISSPNWIHASPYFPTPEGLLPEALSVLDVLYEEFTFIDLGSGKGRVLLMASEFRFEQIIGVEFSDELNEIARRNIANYKSESQECKRISVVSADIAQFEFPEKPLVVYLYNPASEVVIRNAASRLDGSLKKQPRQVWVVYVTPHQIFDSQSSFTRIKTADHHGFSYCVYSNSARARVSALGA